MNTQVTTVYNRINPAPFFFAYIDINECAAGNGGCSHTCVDMIGSYKCMCPEGYELASDKKICKGRVHWSMSCNMLRSLHIPGADLGVNPTKVKQTQIF